METQVRVYASITEVTAEDVGAIIISGSHGGASAASYAREVRALLYVFNDAGVGKDKAGIIALDILEDVGIAAATVSSDSARIGDAADTLACGVVSHVNGCARRLGLAADTPFAEWLSQALANKPK
ncbi:MAG: hypothetical protein AAGG69_01810 [Pseudomonadota bacterium]